MHASYLTKQQPVAKIDLCYATLVHCWINAYKLLMKLLCLPPPSHSISKLWSTCVNVKGIIQKRAYLTVFLLHYFKQWKTIFMLVLYTIIITDNKYILTIIDVFSIWVCYSFKNQIWIWRNVRQMNYQAKKKNSFWWGYKLRVIKTNNENKLCNMK